jgi:hypothetical protein
MGVHGRLRANKCRGLKKEGGNLLRGIPPTKKALTLYQRQSLHGSFKPLTSSAEANLTHAIITDRSAKASGFCSHFNKFFLLYLASPSLHSP